MNKCSMMNVAVTVGEAATDASEVARRLASRVPLTGFDAERTARILDRLSEELAEAATEIRRSGNRPVPPNPPSGPAR
jgi:hypothetical protein